VRRLWKYLHFVGGREATVQMWRDGCVAQLDGVQSPLLHGV
jgi:hypothetical protein